MRWRRTGEISRVTLEHGGGVKHRYDRCFYFTHICVAVAPLEMLKF